MPLDVCFFFSWLHRVDQLIMLGSPLGCFLALRGVDPARGAGLGSAASAQLMQVWPTAGGAAASPGVVQRACVAAPGS